MAISAAQSSKNAANRNREKNKKKGGTSSSTPVIPVSPESSNLTASQRESELQAQRQRFGIAPAAPIKTKAHSSLTKLGSKDLAQSGPYTPAEREQTDYGAPVFPSVDGFNFTQAGGYEAMPVDASTDSLDASEQRRQQIDMARISALDQLKPPSLEDAYLKAEKDADIKGFQKDVSSFTSELNQIKASRDAAMLSLEGQGRGQTAGFIGGEQARINREAAIAALPVQAQLDAAQGNLEMAQSRLDKLFTIYQKDVENEYNFQVKKVESIFSFLDATEQRRADRLLQMERDKANEKQNNINYLRSLGESAISMGRPELVGLLGGIDPLSETFETDVANVARRMTKPVSTAPDFLSIAEAESLGVPYGTTRTQAMQMGITPGVGGGSGLSDTQREKLDDSIASNKELNNLVSEYKDLIDTVGFEGSTFGGENLGKYKALKAKMTTVLKKAETLGTLDEGVRQLVDDIVGQIPEKGVTGQNVFGFQSRMISSQLATTQELIQESIRNAEERLGFTELTVDLDPEDVSLIYSTMGVPQSTPNSFNPDSWF